jgi:hypothetical protein
VTKLTVDRPRMNIPEWAHGLMAARQYPGRRSQVTIENCDLLATTSVCRSWQHVAHRHACRVVLCRQHDVTGHRFASPSYVGATSEVIGTFIVYTKPVG